MNKEQILYWLRKWNDEGVMTVDFNASNLDNVVDELVAFKFESPEKLEAFIDGVLTLKGVR